MFLLLYDRNGRWYRWSVCDVCSSVDRNVPMVCETKCRSRKPGEVLKSVILKELCHWVFALLFVKTVIKSELESERET